MPDEIKPGETLTTGPMEGNSVKVVGATPATATQSNVSQAAPSPHGLSLKTPLPQAASSHAAVHSSRPLAARPPVVGLSSALALSSDPLKMYVEFKNVDKFSREQGCKITQKEMVVTFSGMWDGKMLKAAIRSIENSYKQIKHEKLKESAARKAKEAKL